ncbi:membrane protein insertase YidC, partial [Rhizobium ruizarguesonis]
KAQQQTEQVQQPAAGGETPAQPSGTAPSGQAVAPATLEQALAKTPRVVIATPALSGSINLAGARLDDMKLKGYHA